MIIHNTQHSIQHLHNGFGILHVSYYMLVMLHVCRQKSA